MERQDTFNEFRGHAAIEACAFWPVLSRYELRLSLRAADRAGATTGAPTVDCTGRRLCGGGNRQPAPELLAGRWHGTDHRRQPGV